MGDWHSQNVLASWPFILMNCAWVGRMQPSQTRKKNSGTNSERKNLKSTLKITRKKANKQPAYWNH